MPTYVNLLLKNSALTLVHGVRYRSLFEGPNALNVVECLLSDLMHDALKGVLPLSIRAVADNLIENEMLTKAEFSDLLRCFCNGMNDFRNKPISWLEETGSSLLLRSHGAYFGFCHLLLVISHQLIILCRICICYFQKFVTYGLLRLYFSIG